MGGEIFSDASANSISRSVFIFNDTNGEKKVPVHGWWCCCKLSLSNLKKILDFMFLSSFGRQKCSENASEYQFCSYFLHFLAFLFISKLSDQKTPNQRSARTLLIVTWPENQDFRKLLVSPKLF